MNILIVGGGGREHALAWKAAQSESVNRVFVAPGNAGTAQEKKVQNVPIGAEDLSGLLRFADREKVHLTIVGPEAPLVMGLADAFHEAGLACFGPGASASRLEGSKVFCKEFLSRHRIPTAPYGIFTEVEPALAYIREKGAPIVVKADGLAAGKGVIVAQSVETAEKAVLNMIQDKAFGTAGERVLIEECLSGEEVSFIVMTDGVHILPMATSQDHKARDNGDRGPNTGGMGAYSPAPVVTPDIYQRILEEIIHPTITGMNVEGNPYLGFLYAGLMIAPDGSPRVLEYNCRLGDPETQPILLRLQSDLVEPCLLALQGKLDQAVLKWDQRAALGVVMAAGGYPEQYQKGAPITGLQDDENEGIKVFHAGTQFQNGQIVTSGGRVLCVTACGETVRQARDRAFDRVKRIQWQDVYYRTDIGYRAIARER